MCGCVVPGDRGIDCGSSEAQVHVVTVLFR